MGSNTFDKKRVKKCKVCGNDAGVLYMNNVYIYTNYCHRHRNSFRVIMAELKKRGAWKDTYLHSTLGTIEKALRKLTLKEDFDKYFKENYK
jgi:hypothetical protein